MNIQKYSLVFRKEQDKFLEKYVYNGPTSKPHLFDPKFLEAIQDKVVKSKKIEEELDKFKQEYASHLDKLVSLPNFPFMKFFVLNFHLFFQDKNKFYRYKDKLWILFLTEPKRVVQIIKDATEAASKCHAMKVLSTKIKPNTE